MEAKDTVVHADGCSTNLGIIGATCNCGAEAQAEVSFKAGVKAGRKEVVDWANRWRELAEHGDYSNGVEAFGLDEGSVHAYEFMKNLEAEYEAQLKEWGIE